MIIESGDITTHFLREWEDACEVPIAEREDYDNN